LARLAAAGRAKLFEASFTLRRSSLRPLLLVSSGRALPALDAFANAGDRVELRRVPVLPPLDSLDAERPTVVLLDAALARNSQGLEPLAEQAAIIAVGDAGATEPDASIPAAIVSGFLASDASPSLASVTLRGALRHAVALVAARKAERLEERSTSDLHELTRIGVALSTERDLLTLLGMILSQARRIASADAGSLYLVERREGVAPTLRFKLSQNHTLPNLPFTEFEIPLDHASLAGYAASTGEPLIIPDVYLLPDDVTYKQNRSFDEKFGYTSRSMLVIPMRTHRDEVIGVLQLINRKRSVDASLASVEAVDREVIPFDARAVDLVNALASQAAVAIENGRLYEDIERLFEGFVTAAVTAIESRDPTTSGHSSRVATFTCGLAEAVDRVTSGPYRDQRITREQMREIRYASLLHDFGKVGVREQVLVKQKKLYPSDLAIIKHSSCCSAPTCSTSASARNISSSTAPTATPRCSPPSMPRDAPSGWSCNGSSTPSCAPTSRPSCQRGVSRNCARSTSASSWTSMGWNVRSSPTRNCAT
jgi:hypothetical protein